MKKIIYWFCAVFSAAALAQENPFLNPIGAYEGIAGNTGIGRDGSIGAVIYNPAGMASIKSSKISASGSAFSQNQISNKTADDTDEVKYFQSIPAQISTVFNTDNFNWAFSILVPSSQKYDRRVINGDLVFDETLEDQETVFGPSIGFKLSKSLSLGISLFGSKRDFRETSSVFFEDGTGAITQSRQFDINGITAYPIVGVLYTPSSNFSLGLKWVGPSTSLSGTFEDKDKTAGDNTSLGIPNRQATKKGDVTFQKPMELGIGVSARLFGSLKLYLDATNQFAKEYNVVDEDVYGESTRFEYKTTQRYNAAIEYMTSHTDAITLGFMYNPDPLKDSELNFIGGTIGYRSIDDISDSSFGLFYNQASDNSEGVERSQKMIGLFISSAINFGT